MTDTQLVRDFFEIPEHVRMGDYFADFLDGECREHGLTQGDLEAWRPAKKTRGGTKAAKKTKKNVSNG